MSWAHALHNVGWVAGHLKPVLECLALIGGSYAVFKWFEERKDRATDVLLKLEEHFNHDRVRAGRLVVEDDDRYTVMAPTLNSNRRQEKMTEAHKNLDDLLRFYVVVYAIRQANQVSDKALSTCYRFWLGHYYLDKRKELRTYINKSFPTLSDWLTGDTPTAREAERRFPWKVKPAFFTPEHFWEPETFNLDPKTLNPDKRHKPPRDTRP